MAREGIKTRRSHCEYRAKCSKSAPSTPCNTQRNSWPSQTKRHCPIGSPLFLFLYQRLGLLHGWPSQTSRPPRVMKSQNLRMLPRMGMFKEPSTGVRSREMKRNRIGAEPIINSTIPFLLQSAFSFSLSLPPTPKACPNCSSFFLFFGPILSLNRFSIQEMAPHKTKTSSVVHLSVITLMPLVLPSSSDANSGCRLMDRKFRLLYRPPRNYLSLSAAVHTMTLSEIYPCRRSKLPTLGSWIDSCRRVLPFSRPSSTAQTMANSRSPRGVLVSTRLKMEHLDSDTAFLPFGNVLVWLISSTPC